MEINNYISLQYIDMHNKKHITIESQIPCFPRTFNQVTKKHDEQLLIDIILCLNALMGKKVSNLKIRKLISKKKKQTSGLQNNNNKRLKIHTDYVALVSIGSHLFFVVCQWGRASLRTPEHHWLRFLNHCLCRLNIFLKWCCI